MSMILLLEVFRLAVNQSCRRMWLKAYLELLHFGMPKAKQNKTPRTHQETYWTTRMTLFYFVDTLVLKAEMHLRQCAFSLL